MNAAGRSIPALLFHEFDRGKLVRAGQRNLADDCRLLQVGLCLVFHGANIILNARTCKVLFETILGPDLPWFYSCFGLNHGQENPHENRD